MHGRKEAFHFPALPGAEDCRLILRICIGESTLPVSRLNDAKSEVEYNVGR